MKRMLKILVRCGIVCFAVWLLFVVMVRIHLQTRVNADWYAEGVSRILDVSRDKFILVNDPRHLVPNPIFECVEDRAAVLGRCTAILPAEDDSAHLSDKDRMIAQLESAREAWIRNVFNFYGIELKETVNIYVANGESDAPVDENWTPFWVVESAGHVYIMCYKGL